LITATAVKETAERLGVKICHGTYHNKLEEFCPLCLCYMETTGILPKDLSTENVEQWFRDRGFNPISFYQGFDDLVFVNTNSDEFKLGVALRKELCLDT
jgi:hypothetical protein